LISLKAVLVGLPDTVLYRSYFIQRLLLVCLTRSCTEAILYRDYCWFAWHGLVQKLFYTEIIVGLPDTVLYRSYFIQRLLYPI